MILISIFLISIFIVPTALVSLNNDVTMQSLATPAQIQHDARIAIYDEDNVTVPANSAAENLTNHVDALVTLLEGVGHEVTLLTTADILNHELLTIDYDIFIMINNIPRESISKLVKEFWLGGGSLLSFNGAMSYLWYEEILWPGYSLDPRGGAWDYLPIDAQNVSIRHPTMKQYHVNDTVMETTGNWAVVSKAVMDSSDIASDYVYMLSNMTLTNIISAFAVENVYRGGRIVQLPGDGSSFTSDLRSIIIDSVDWLIPRPRGRIAYDLSHQPRLYVDIWDGEFATTWDPLHSFAQFRTLAVNHTYTFDKFYPTSTGNFTATRLADYDVLVIAWPDLNYTSAEIQVVEEWVNGGGSLLVLGDRHGLGGNPGDLAINDLLHNSDISLGTSNLLDNQIMTPGTHITLEACTSLSMSFRNHLIVSGNATTLWLEVTEPVVAAQQLGKGRAILVADMNIFDNSLLGQTDNEQFALNALNWLSSSKATILLFTSYFAEFSPAAEALRDLGMKFELSRVTSSLVDFIDSENWSLIIIDQSYLLFSDPQLDKIYAYVNGGGTLLMSYYGMDDDDTHPVWSKLGVEYSADLTGEPTLYLWDKTHPIFSTPNDHSDANYTAGNVFADDGDSVTVLAGFTALAGRTATEQADNAFIVLGNSGKTLLNSYLIDGLITDTDDSTYQDSVELWQNEIVFMTTPPGGGFPFDMTTLLIIGGAALALIIVVALVMKRRSSAPTPKPKKKSTKK
jgi:hypothetical protein